MRSFTLYKILAIFSVFLIILFFPKTTNLATNFIDNCLKCHEDYGSIDEAHSVEIFGCATCHGGDKYADEKDLAHKNMVKNPANLQHANIFCSKCHKEITQRVSLSLMQTQQGIKNVLQEQWVDKATSKNLSKSELKELADSHYAKGCASCHVNQNEDMFFDKSLAKGGGCSDCHRIKQQDGKHTKFSAQIPSSNCLKCHNRSNRIGTSYFGKFESEGYGTPYKNAEFSNRLDSDRFFYELPPDVHHTKAKMECIDCHTHVEIMGDGHSHANMEYALDITCLDCHAPNFKAPDEMAKRLVRSHENFEILGQIAYTKKKNTPIYNLQKRENKEIFITKIGKQEHNLTLMSDKPYHTLDIHKRLDCSACHATWIASCYGCHEVYFDSATQFDWKLGKTTKGQWMELRSFLRYESPTLGVGYNEKIMPFAPGCQVIGTVFKDDEIKSFHAMAMAGWEPHTTGKARECVECHFDSTTLGLGRGILDFKNNSLKFQPFYDSNASGMPFSYPIDAFVSLDGKQFQTTSRQNARSFNKDEIDRITNAYKCIICHRSYDDKIYRDFNTSVAKFQSGKTQCLE